MNTGRKKRMNNAKCSISNEQIKNKNVKMDKEERKLDLEEHLKEA
jgi:hypothetical protein